MSLADIQSMKALKIAKQNASNISNLVISPSKTSFAVQTGNLFDFTTVQGGYNVGLSTGTSIDNLITTTDVSGGANYAVSAVYNLDIGTYTISFKPNNRVSGSTPIIDIWTPSDRLYAGFVNLTTNADGTYSFTLSQNRLVRFLFKHSVYDGTSGFRYQDFKFVKGNTIPSKFGLTIPGLIVDDGSITEKNFDSNVTTKLNNKSVTSLTRWYQGKILTTYGDSITAMGYWQPYVMSYFGITTHNNRGIGGTTFSNNATTTTVDANGNYVATGGTIINSWLCSSQRIATIPTNSDVILVMGGTNDMGQNIPIGGLNSVTGLTDSDFKNAVATTIKQLVQGFPNAKIIFMTPVGGRNGGNVNADFQDTTTAGATTTDYANAMISVCQYYGIPCIDLNGTTGISTLNHTTFLQDSVHPNNTTGAKAMSQAVIQGLIRYEPITLT